MISKIRFKIWNFLLVNRLYEKNKKTKTKQEKNIYISDIFKQSYLK